MSEVAYIDTSAFLCVVFQQGNWKSYLKKLQEVKLTLSSDLLMSEAAAAFIRDDLALEHLTPHLDNISLITGDISLELIEKVLSISYLRGADTHHLVNALWFCEGKTGDILFLTADEQQRLVAKKLGFEV